MAACAWSVAEDAADSVLFHCASCAREIRFVKEGYGFPNPMPDGASWRPPENVLDWLDPCS
jgi:hypothetical protein